MSEKPCKECGTLFTPRRSGRPQLYYSKRCYWKVKRERKPEYYANYRKQYLPKYWADNREALIVKQQTYRHSNLKNANTTALKCHMNNKAAWMEEIKKRGMDRCFLCGYNKCFAAIDFHHIDPSDKEIRISAVIRMVPTEKRKAELDKCVALCANCHRETHVNMVKYKKENQERII